MPQNPKNAISTDRSQESVDEITADFHDAVDSTARVRQRAAADEISAIGQDCLELIEAIRLTAPEYLDDVLNDAPAPPIQGTEFDKHFVPTLPIEGRESIGRFRIIRPLGRGGHGIVFLAHDPTLNRDVALKVPKPETLMTESLRRRFLREAEAAAALDHPNIVPIFESGMAGPVCYIAAAYCPGEPLSAWVRKQRGGAPPKQAAEVTVALADAVQHAHARGILHRDIKPSNALIDEANGSVDFSCSVKLTDFGLARLEQRSAHDTLSLYSEVLGTPSYMSPEQASGPADAVTTATDVYGLGATLYHLLTGQPPHQRETQLKTLIAVQQEEPAQPCQLSPDVPRDLEAICLKCLEKQPARRYATAADLRDDLQRFLRGESVHARSLGRAVRVARWSRARPGLTALTAALLLSVLAGAASVLVQWRRAERHLAESQRQQGRAEQHLISARQAVDELLTEVALGLKDTPQLQSLRRNLLLKAAEMNQRLLSEDPADGRGRIDSIEAWRRAAEIFAELGDTAQSSEAIEKGLQLSSAAGPWRKLAVSEDEAQRRSFQEALLYRQRGELLRSNRKYKDARADFRKSVKRLEQLVNIGDRGMQYHAEAAESTRLIGLSFVDVGDYKSAEVHLKAAVEKFDVPFESTAGEHRQPAVLVRHAAALRSLASHYEQTGQYQDALAQLDIARTLLVDLVEQNPLVTRYQLQLAELDVARGATLTAIKQYEDAEPIFAAAVGTLRRLSADFPLSPTIKYWLAEACNGHAIALFQFERYEQSEALHVEASAILEDVADRLDEPQMKRKLVSSFGLVSKMHRLRGDFEGAEAAAMKALAVAEQLTASPASSYMDQKALANAWFDIARLQLAQGDRRAALKSCRHTVEIRELMRATNPTDFASRTHLANGYAILASLEAGLGRTTVAAGYVPMLIELAPNNPKTRAMAAILWLQLAYNMEQWARLGIQFESDWSVEQCREEAIRELNFASTLDDFRPNTVTRLESFGDLMRNPEYRSQLAEVYQQIDLNQLAPPMPDLTLSEALEGTDGIALRPPDVFSEYGPKN